MPLHFRKLALDELKGYYNIAGVPWLPLRDQALRDIPEIYPRYARDIPEI